MWCGIHPRCSDLQTQNTWGFIIRVNAYHWREGWTDTGNKGVHYSDQIEVGADIFEGTGVLSLWDPC